MNSKMPVLDYALAAMDIVHAGEPDSIRTWARGLMTSAIQSHQKNIPLRYQDAHLGALDAEQSPGRVSDWLLNPEAQTLFLPGPTGCVAGETKIWNPTLASYSRIEDLYRRGESPWVQTLSGPSRAEVPFIKGVDRLYRVILANGESSIVTSRHLFLTPDGWQSLAGSEGLSGLSVGTELLTGSPVNALRCSRRGADSQGDCLTSRHLCDQPLPRGSVASLSFSPSRSDALEHNHSHWLQDVRASRQAHSHSYQESSRPSKMDSGVQSVLEIEDCLVGSRAMQDARYHDASSTREPDSLSYQQHLQSHSKSLQLLPSQRRCHDASDMLRYGQADSSCRNNRSQWVPIRQIVYVRDDYYYDIHVPGDENYLADGIWSHNSGKTFTAWALATQVVIDQVIQASQGVIAEVPTSGVIPVSDLLDELRSEGRLPGTWQWLRKTPVLGLDDLGAARPTAWALEKMWSLVNARTANGLKTIITTNSDWTALVATWGEPMMDRLRDRSVTIELLGASRRALIPA